MGSRDPTNKQDTRWALYMHTSPSGKKYVGITSENPPEKRWGVHGHRYLIKNKNGKYVQPKIAHAVNKYPDWDAWRHEILLTNETEEYVKKAEKCLIKAYKTTDPKNGYNITSGGDGTCGIRLSEERKARLRELRTGTHLSEETKEKLRQYMIGKMKGKKHPLYGTTRTIEQRLKTSNTLKEKYKNGLIVHSKGIPLSEEAKKKISDKLKGEKHPLYGKHHTEESKRKMSISKKNFLSNKENHPNYGKHLSEKTKQKISNSQKGVMNTAKRPVYCIEMDMIFYGAKHVNEIFGFDSSGITKCCKGKREYAYRHKDTGEKLHWIYADDAITKGYITKEDVDNLLINLINDKKEND